MHCSRIVNGIKNKNIKKQPWSNVVWLIQALALNQICHSTNDRCEALASPKGCFLCFCFCAPSIYPLNPKCAHLRTVFKSRFYDYRFFCVTL